ncbi:putative protein conserved in bacteria, partial [Dysosmobacter welbionis]
DQAEGQQQGQAPLHIALIHLSAAGEAGRDEEQESISMGHGCVPPCVRSFRGETPKLSNRPEKPERASSHACGQASVHFVRAVPARSRSEGAVECTRPDRFPLPHSSVRARVTAAAAVAYRLTPSWTARCRIRRRRLSRQER